MRHWKKAHYSLLGPLIIWVFLAMAAPPTFGVAIARSVDLPPLADSLMRTVIIFCMIVLAPLAALAEIAPPFVTRREVSWRNRNSEQLFDGDVAWGAVPFLPPALNRIRSTIGKRRKQEEADGAVTFDGTKPTLGRAEVAHCVSAQK